MLDPKRLACLLASLLLLQTTALAWGDAGHMVVAQIALESLSGTPAQRGAKAAELNSLAGLIEFAGRKQYDFATSACWMDDLRDDDAFELLRDWHFITLRFFDGIPKRDLPTPALNNAAMIKSARSMLLDKDSDPRPRKAYYVAVLTHLIGDLHQPLHCSTRYTVSRPDGDFGGNSFKITVRGRESNLHSFWDAAGGFFEAKPFSRPLGAAGRRQLRDHAASIMARFPRSDFGDELKESDPFEWAEDSHHIAKENAYEGINEGATPDDPYVKKVRELSPKRMALAGYRLAQILDELPR